MPTAPPTPPSGPADRPNIVYIMADQMAAPLLKMYAPDAPIKTPHLDALAAGGVVFENAYCPSPLCAPSRACMLAGQLPSKIGAFDNASALSSDVPTFAHMLRAEGYQTALAGKMHFIGPDQLHGFEHRLTADIYPADFGWAVNWDDPDQRLEWYHNMSSVNQAGPCVRSNQLDFDDEVVFKARQYLYDYVRQKPAERRPLSLTVSLTHPHDPYTITADYWDLYADADIPLPSVDIADEDQDPHSARILRCIDAWGKKPTAEAIRRARRAYFGSCSYVDAQVGALLRTLAECGIADDTIVVFSGDHGDMLGERGLWYKMSWFEASARVPLLVHHPRRFAPARVAQPVSTLDLPLTFLDMAGGPVRRWTDLLPLDGRSLAGALAGASLPDAGVFGEYMGEGAITPVMMIRRGRWKYTLSLVDPPQLFDLGADPAELVNLVGPDGKVADAATATAETAEAARAFAAEAAAKWDLRAIHAAALAAQRQRRLCWGALTKGKFDAWDYHTDESGRDKYIRSTIPLDDLELKARFPPVDEFGRAMPPGYLPPLSGASLR